MWGSIPSTKLKQAVSVAKNSKSQTHWRSLGSLGTMEWCSNILCFYYIKMSFCSIFWHSDSIISIKQVNLAGTALRILGLICVPTMIQTKHWHTLNFSIHHSGSCFANKIYWNTATPIFSCYLWLLSSYSSRVAKFLKKLQVWYGLS
jgi:hypothetical protein